ncbi:hypothetical protein CBR_g74627 [Chara braunii]|uniref:Uncharacterized protein n=1 Tax=Chara braunii TaxID=69332 RepID=A0A388KA69_CHABU|nr:hypothetical protein CBR_g74627 [Chara braunii]|eukprot:GBG66940.1 hypothetical protein CBR_g74627 [Chara braunii]
MGERSKAWLEIGELLVKSDLAGALDALKRARMLMDKKKQPVPLELLNNIGVLHYELGAYDEAKEAYAEALGPGPWVALLGAKWPDAKHKGRQPALKIPVDSTVVPAEKLTTLFNLARMLERQHETLLAGDLYTLIVEQYPKYIDCYLRLASMAHNRRDYAAAMGFINDALKVDEDNIDVLSMKGLLEMKGDSWVKARETFKEVQQLTQQKDTYSMVALVSTADAGGGNKGRVTLTMMSTLQVGRAVLLWAQRACTATPHNRLSLNTTYWSQSYLGQLPV